MKVIVTTLILGAVIALTACGGSTKESSGVQQPGDIDNSAPGKQASTPTAETTSKAELFSPYIGSGYPGKFTPSKDLVTDIYALAHGQTVEGGWVEQWFLAKKDAPLATGGLKLKTFPHCLPLATAASSDTFVWQWNTLANGNAGVKWTGADFYSYIKSSDFLGDDTTSTTYVLGVGRSVEMAPEDNALSPKPGDKGLVQAFKMDDRPKCEWQVFALPFKDCPVRAGDPTCFLKPFEQYRRVMQAWTETECELLKADEKDRRYVRALPIAEMTYGDWREGVSSWASDSLWSTDGEVLRDDNGDVTLAQEELKDMSFVKPFFANK